MPDPDETDMTGWAEQGEAMIGEIGDLMVKYKPSPRLAVGVVASVFMGTLRALVKFGDAKWARREALQWSRELRKFSEES